MNEIKIHIKNLPDQTEMLEEMRNMSKKADLPSESIGSEVVIDFNYIKAHEELSDKLGEAISIIMALAVANDVVKNEIGPGEIFP